MKLASGLPARRGGHAVLALLIGACMAVSACGDTSTQASWVSGHPDTALVSFKTNAPGVCAITVQYPNDAPAAITYLAALYVQVAREARPANAGGKQVDRSGDWTVLSLDNGDLMLLTAAYAYRYRLESNC